MGTLTTKEGKPISYNTKWEELSLQTQEYLLKIEQSVMDTRAACRNLESNNRIMDHSLLQKHDQEQEATVILQGLRSLAGMLHSDKNALKNFQSEVVSLLRDTEFAVRSYQRTTARRQADAAIASGASIPASMLESLGEPPVLPISYLKETLQGFEKALSNYQSRIDELEKILLPAAGISSQGYKEREVGVDFGVPGILNNLHEYFVHVAALVAKVHERASSLRTEFLTYQRKMGMLKNPFEEAEKKEVRQREAVLSSNGTVQAGGALVSPAPSQYTHVTGQVQHTPPPTSMLSSTGLAGGGMQGGMPQFGSPGTGFGSSGFGSQFQTPATSGGDGNRGRRSGRRR